MCRLQRESKRAHFLHLISSGKHPSSIWKALKAACPPAPTESWSGFNCSHSQLASLLNKHFVSVSASNTIPSSSSSSSSIRDLPAQCTHPFQLHTIQADECEEELSNLRINQSSGPDAIPASVLKLSAATIARPVCSIFNASLATSVFPSLWKHAHVKPLHKGGDKLSLSNYRPISLAHPQ